MLHTVPTTTSGITARLEELAEFSAQLQSERPPRRWSARLRRMARGTVAASSVSIEGFHVRPEVATAILAGDRRPATHDDEVVAAYGRAMDHVVAHCDDPQFKWNHRVIADLHFDLAWPDPQARPGRLRQGAMSVTGADGLVEYTAPEPAEATKLMAELVTWLRRGDLDAPLEVRAAMAHLHLVSIHPFADGNGRVSRVLQSLVLGLGGRLAPELASIEEYLSVNTDQYRAALQDAHGPVYDPARDATGWVEFCLHAHVETARDRVRLIAAASRRWTQLEAVVADRRWPERLTIALEQALTSGLDRASYVAEAEVSEASASSDLRRLVDAGLLEVAGAGRTTRYTPAAALRAIVA